MLIVGINGQTKSGKDTVADRLGEEHGFVRVALADPIKRFGMQMFGFSYDQMFGPQNIRDAHDKRYNEISKFEMDDAWAAAYNNICDHGYTFVQDLLGQNTDPDVLNAAYHDMICWFNWLGAHYPELTPRIMMQTFGTEWGRAVDPDIWVEYFMHVKSALARGGKYNPVLGLKEKTQDPIYKGIVVPDIRFINEFNYLHQRSGFLIRIRRPETDIESAFVGIPGHSSEAEQKGIPDDSFDMVILNDGSLDDLYRTVDMIPIILRSKDV